MDLFVEKKVAKAAKPSLKEIMAEKKRMAEKLKQSDEIMVKEKLKHFYSLLTRFVTTRQMSTMFHNEESIEKQSRHILCAEWRFSAGNAISALGNTLKDYENAKRI